MLRKLVEYSLIIAGLVCLTIFASSVFRYRLFQAQAVGRTFRSATNPPIDDAKRVPSVIGQVIVKRIGLSVAMVEGDDEQSLAIAAGHMPGTAMVGKRGNIVIAGHRDTAFWPLRHIRAGDLIDIKTATTSTYRVTTTEIIDPSETGALADTPDSMLTLVTCYPFRHVGPAPERFIVRASLVK